MNHETKVQPEASRTGEITYRWHCADCQKRGKAKGSAAVSRRAGEAHTAAKVAAEAKRAQRDGSAT